MHHEAEHLGVPKHMRHSPEAVSSSNSSLEDDDGGTVLIPPRSLHRYKTYFPCAVPWLGKMVKPDRFLSVCVLRCM